MHDATFVVSLPFDRLRVSVIRRSLVVSLSNHRLRVSGKETASITTERHHLTPSENKK